MPGKDRLNKRKAMYLNQYNAFSKVRKSDPLYGKMKTCADNFKKLNAIIEELNPLDVNGNRKDNLVNDGKLDDNQLDEMISLYEGTILTINEIATDMNNRIEELQVLYNDTDNRELKRQYKTDYNKSCNLAAYYDLLAKTMSKDLRAFSDVKAGKQKCDLHEIYESSRVASDYVVVKHEMKNEKGNQNERIPVTIKRENEEEEVGYFTPDNKTPSGNYIEDEFEKAKKKYGKDADFITYKKMLEIIQSFGEYDKKTGNEVTRFIHSDKEWFLCGDSFEFNYNYLQTRTWYDLSSYIKNPKRLSIFVDLASTTLRATNKLAINKSIGIRPVSNVNRRNAAMSKMAEILGISDLIAFSENVKLDINGKTVKGTFMRDAKGSDAHKNSLDSPFLACTAKSYNSLKIKKQIANMQILDYLCGNPDRHGGNVLYRFTNNPDGSVNLDSICGIDNDSCMGEGVYERIPMDFVQDLRIVKVMTAEMAEKIMDLNANSLKTMFYGYELNTKELNNMVKRLEALKKKIKDDSKEYEKGYTKGSLIPGKLKVVKDDELTELSMADDLAYDKANGKNLFSVIVRDLNGEKKNKELNFDVYVKYAKCAHKITSGSIAKINDLIGRLDRDDRLGGSSSGYDKMFREIKELKKRISELQGPLINNNMNLRYGHCDELKAVREKLHTTLESVNDYIFYKDGKKKGEEWRNIKGHHEQSRTERRYYDALACREFLNKQLDLFEELDKDHSEILDVKRNRKDKLDKYNELSKNYTNSKEYADEIKRREDNLYRNNISRTLFLIGEAVKERDNCDQNAGSMKEIYQAKLDIVIGYGIDGIKENDRKEFRDELEKRFGLTIKDSDKDLFVRAVASDMVVSKLGVKNEIGKINDRLFHFLSDIKTFPVSDSIQKLIDSDVFKTFYKDAEPEFELMKNYHSMMASVPNKKQKEKIFGIYRKAYINAHPEKADKMDKVEFGLDKQNNDSKVNAKNVVKKTGGNKMAKGK